MLETQITASVCEGFSKIVENQENNGKIIIVSPFHPAYESVIRIFESYEFLMWPF